MSGGMDCMGKQTRNRTVEPLNNGHKGQAILPFLERLSSS